MPKVGIEPTRGCPHWILSPARLPVPPLRLTSDFSQGLWRVSREMRKSRTEDLTDDIQGLRIQAAGFRPTAFGQTRTSLHGSGDGVTRGYGTARAGAVIEADKVMTAFF